MSDNLTEGFLTTGAVITYIFVMTLWCNRLLKNANNYVMNNKFKVEVTIFFILGGIIFMPIINSKK
jgi:hypothetical protein